MSSYAVLFCFPRSITFILIASLLAGCTSLPSLKPLSRLHDDLARDLGPQVNEFNTCSLHRFELPSSSSGQQSMGSTETSSSSAVSGTVPAKHPLDEIKNELQAILDLSLDPKKLGGEIDTLINSLKNPAERPNINFMLHRDAFRSFADAAKQIHMDLILDDLLKKPMESRSRFEKLLINYYRAYFGTLEIEAQTNDSVPTSALHANFVTKGFIDRNGNAFTFPGLSMDLTLASNDRLSFHASAVDSKRLSSDSVRILLEAFFDAVLSVPADDRATATKIDLDKRYPKWTDLKGIDASASSKITMAAIRAETIVTSGMGEAVRGGALFSLNNETLAAGIETAAGVTAKKLVEHEAFCYFKAKSKTSSTPQR